MDKTPKYFFDTCVLMNHYDNIFKSDSKFVISILTLEELEEIKTSAFKSEETKFKARQATRLLSEHQDSYDVELVTDEIIKIVDTVGMEEKIDSFILATVIYHYKNISDITFVTDDLSLYNISTQLSPVPVKLGKEIFNDTGNVYKGYKEIKLSNWNLDYFCNHLNENLYHNLINEYLIVNDENNEPAYKFKWDGSEYKKISYKQIKSNRLGILKPKDVYQECAFDSINNNDITVLTGRAGAGKTTIPLNYFAKCLETEKIRKLYVIYHFEPLKGARSLGYEKGDHLSKLLNTGSIANILASKFGDITSVERMIQDDKLEIIPTANIRGVELPSDVGLMVTEAQDIDTYTLKTILQRCKDGCKQVYEGDLLEQNDLNGRMSGLNKMIDVFKGNSRFGCIKLENNYRSELCTLADKMQ
jgi:PhoH-like ATPase